MLRESPCPRKAGRRKQSPFRLPERCRDEEPGMTARGSSGDASPWRWTLPTVLVALSFFVLMAFETGYAIHDREGLADQLRLQEPAVQEAMKLRHTLEALAG